MEKKFFQNSLLERQGSIILVGLIVLYTLFSIQFVSAFGYGNKGIGKTISISLNNTNSSDFWDNLDTPADISGSQINNDLGWITSYTETDPSWSSNFTNMKVDCPAGNYTYGILNNGTLKCRSDLTGAGAETDPIFVAENVSLWNSINLRLLISDQRYNETTWVLSQGYLTSIPDNSTKLYCGNITGAVSDLCTITSGGNLSFNQSLTDTLYIFQSNEAKLNVNSSDYWDNLNSINATQMQDNGGILNILESWLTNLFNALFGTKTTDDLTEGTTNYYDNRSWNQSLANTLYGFSNSSFNQSLTDTLYAGIEWDYNQSIPAIEVANAYTDAVNDSQASWITSTFLSIANALSQYFNKTDIQEKYYNKTDIDTFGFVNSTGLDAYNETDWVLAQDYLTSYDESDPIFIAENSTIWTAINNRLTLTDQRFNETTLILAINTTSNIMSLSFYNKSEINNLVAGVGNSSFNQSLTDILYASIVWGYNQTQPAIDYVDAQGFITNGVQNNTAGWVLNFTKIFSNDWSNITITEAQIIDLGDYLTEETDPLFIVENVSIWNEAKDKFNLTYHTILNQQCPDGNYTYQIQANGTILCRSDISGAGAETDPVWTANFSLGYYLNHTLAVFNLWGKWFYNMTTPANTYTDTKVGTDNLHKHSILNVTGTDDNVCSGTDKVKNVTFKDGNLMIVCSEDLSGIGGDFYFANFTSSWNLNWTAKDYDKWMYNQTTPANVYTDTKTSTANLHLHSLLNITGTDDNACTGTDKVINVTFNNGNLQIVCTTDETGGAGDGTGGWTNTSTETNTSLNVNINNGANVTANYGFLKLAWSYLQSVPNIIYGLWNGYNANSLLISNGTAIGYNETVLNNSIRNVGLLAGFNATYNATYAGYNETTWALSKFIPFNGTTTNLTIQNIISPNTQTNVLTNINMTSKNVTSVDCIIFKSGGSICST